MTGLAMVLESKLRKVRLFTVASPRMISNQSRGARFNVPRGFSVRPDGDLKFAVAR